MSSSESEITAEGVNNSDLKFISDKPTQNDEIGTHSFIAENLKKIITSELPKPFVIGLFGSWGSGKSSIVEMLVEKHAQKFQIVVVDAWRKDKANFLRQFIKKLAWKLLPLKKADEVCEDVDFKKSTQESSWVPGAFAKIAFACFLMAVLIYVAVIVTIWWKFHSDPEFHNYPIKEIGGSALLVLTAVMFQWLLPQYSRKTDTKEEEITIEDPAWFRNIFFNRILNEVSEPPICVVIDNLDRVPADDALAIIKFIKTFIVDTDTEKKLPDKAKVVFLIPCDDRQLLNRIKESDGIENPDEFLHKFINVSLRIPPLLDQDNDSYIRNLIRKIEFRGTSRATDNLAFMISRACVNNPRKPKVVLNHFVARFNLAKSFPACRGIVEEHPDWFALHSILECAFSNASIPDNVQDLKTFGQGIPPSTPPGLYGFTNAIRPIVEEVSAEAWHMFQYLKHPKVYELIPGFRDMISHASDRNIEKFNQLFGQLLPSHPNLVSYMWNERKDWPSRMAFAEGFLWIYEKTDEKDKCEIPYRVFNDVAQMIAARVSGWTYLPADTTYNLVLKPRPDALSSALSGLTDGNLDSSAESQQFLQEIVVQTMRDNYEGAKFSKEIQSILDHRANKSVELAISSVNFPEYPSSNVYSTCLGLFLKGESNPGFSAESIVNYIKATVPSPQISPTRWLQEMVSALQAQWEKRQPRDSAYSSSIKLGFELCRAWIEQPLKALLTPSLDFILKFLNQFGGCKTEALWEEAGLIYEFVIQLLDHTDPNLKNTAIERYQALSQDVFQNAPETLVERLIKQHADTFHNRNVQLVVTAGARSSYMAKFIFREFPEVRSNLVDRLVPSKTEWLPQIATAFAKNKLISEEFGRLLVNHAKNHRSENLYTAISKIVKTEAFTQLLENHFDQRMSSINLTVISELDAILRAMFFAQYAPTEAQEAKLRTAKDSIRNDQLTEDQKNIFSRFFAK